MDISYSQQRIIEFIYMNLGIKFDGDTYDKAYKFIGKYKKKAEATFHNKKYSYEEDLSSYGFSPSDEHF